MPETSHALKWDATGQKMYSTCTKEGILYVGSTSAYNPETDKSAYVAGVAWNGLTGVTETPSGAEANDNYADDIKYISIRGAEKFAFTVEAFMAPDEWEVCDGSRWSKVGTKNIAKFGQQERRPFGMAFKTVLGNDTYKNENGFDIHLEFNATASPSERAYKTIGENPELLTFSWECDADPVAVGENAKTGGITKPTCNIIVRCTVDNQVLHSVNGNIEINRESDAPQQAKNVALLIDVLQGTTTTLPTLPQPDVVYEILNLTGSESKTVADYAIAAV
jgi:hypothetical protein